MLILLSQQKTLTNSVQARVGNSSWYGSLPEVFDGLLFEEVLDESVADSVPNKLSANPLVLSMESSSFRFWSVTAGTAAPLASKSAVAMVPKSSCGFNGSMLLKRLSSFSQAALKLSVPSRREMMSSKFSPWRLGREDPVSPSHKLDEDETSETGESGRTYSGCGPVTGRLH